MLVELDTVVVFVVEGSVVFVNCLIVALDVVEGLGEVVKVGLLLELDILVDVLVYLVVVVVVVIVVSDVEEVLLDLVEIVISAAFMLPVLLDVGNFGLVGETRGGKFSVIVLFNIIAEFSVVSLSSTVITFSKSMLSSGKLLSVIRGPKFHNGLSVFGLGAFPALSLSWSRWKLGCLSSLFLLRTTFESRVDSIS